MLEFEILAHGLFSPSQLDITYDPTLSMPITPAIQSWMDALWQEKLRLAREKGVPLYDAPLFRLVNVAARKDGMLSILLGNTSYKEYVTTREPSFALHHARQELGNAISTCSVVETSDAHILLDKRQGVDVYVGRYHVIGGFFERDLDMSPASSDADQRPDPFAAMRREIREETGIQAADIVSQHCLGVVYDIVIPHAEFCFLTRLNIPLSTVLTRTPEEDEIKQLHTLYVTAESLREFIVAHHGHISATGEPNLLLYGKVRFGEAWFDEVMKRL
jgi:8-oxo-dGTP pyrophosphatase MutT (NUDIX family)